MFFDDQATSVGTSIVFEAMACGLEFIISTDDKLKYSIIPAMVLSYDASSFGSFEVTLEEVVSSYWSDEAILRRRKYQIAAINYFSWGVYGYSKGTNPTGRINEWMYYLASEIKDTLGVGGDVLMDKETIKPILPDDKKLSTLF